MQAGFALAQPQPGLEQLQDSDQSGQGVIASHTNPYIKMLFVVEILQNNNNFITITLHSIMLSRKSSKRFIVF